MFNKIMKLISRALFIFVYLFLISSEIHSQSIAVQYYPDGTYEKGIPPPEDVLGFPVGEKPVRYSEVIAYLNKLASVSPRVKLMKFGETYEGRGLYYVIISSQENISRLKEIRSNITRLADPRKLKSDAEAMEIIKSSPAVAWMAYAIHGDELSSTDAAIQLAYQLAAGKDPLTTRVRDELVVCIDPMENPDGRERFLSQMEQWGGQIPNSDAQSIQHTSIWPWGRGNHYLFDMNRDWFILSLIESRARVSVILRWNPQILVDSHEMGSFDTYLFSPPRQPFNPNLSDRTKKWWKVFASDQAKAFDRYGWSYYTREWNEEWFPGYGSSWSLYIGAVGILYEQAGTEGSLVKRPDGSILNFQEAVHHHFVSSMANLTTAAENRIRLLRDFYDGKKENMKSGKKEDSGVYYILPGENATRANRLVERLLLQNIEVEESTKDFRVGDLWDYWGSKPEKKTLPQGTFIINVAQPMRPLVNAIMGFDPRMPTSFLEDERYNLQKKKETRIYEVTSWSLPLAYGLEVYRTSKKSPVNTKPVKNIYTPEGKVINPTPSFGYLIDYRDDIAVEALVKLLEMGYKVRSAKKPFNIEGRSYSRGSILLKILENPTTLPGYLEKVAQSTGVTIYGVNTAMSTQGPDLGGNEFQLLEMPRIALVTGPPINLTSFSSIWYLLDRELVCRFSILNSANFAGVDLNKYNVLILPSTWGGPEVYRGILGEKGIEKMKGWVEDGGTLIGIGNGAAFLADTSTGVSKVKLRRQALKELPVYENQVKYERKIEKEAVDSLEVWEGKGSGKKEEKVESKQEIEEQELIRRDEWMRLFMPRGAILNAELDEEHWLAFGVGERVPAIIYTSFAFLSRDPVETAGRFSNEASLRLSGLLWPEARERWANTAYLTREEVGRGQVILFAGDPNFRTFFYGTRRLLVNSLLLGPGFGTKRTVPW
jgi:hypothetical protein